MNASEQPAPALPLPNKYRVLEQHVGPSAWVVMAEAIEVPTQCPHCQSEHIGAWGSREQVFRDLPCAGKPVEIHINTRRLICKDCEKTFSQLLPGISERRLMTERLRQWVGEQGLQRTFISIAEDIGVVEGTVRNVFADFVEAMEQAVHIQTPEWLLLHEVHMLNRPRTLVLDAQARTLVDMLVGRNRVVISKYLSRLRDAKNVKLVGMGFSGPAREAVHGFLPGASIFIDKPYVLALADKALTSVGIELREKIAQSEKRTLWPLLHAPFSSLTESEQVAVEDLRSRYPQLEAVCKARDGVYLIYDQPESGEGAYEALSIIAGDPHAGEARHFTSLNKALLEWGTEIRNYFKREGHSASIVNMGDVSHLGVQIEGMGRNYVFEALRCRVLFPEHIPEIHYTTLGINLDHLQKT